MDSGRDFVLPHMILLIYNNNMTRPLYSNPVLVLVATSSFKCSLSV
jgi:hypothetical protein